MWVLRMNIVRCVLGLLPLLLYRKGADETVEDAQRLCVGVFGTRVGKDVDGLAIGDPDLFSLERLSVGHLCGEEFLGGHAFDLLGSRFEHFQCGILFLYELIRDLADINRPFREGSSHTDGRFFIRRLDHQKNAIVLREDDPGNRVLYGKAEFFRVKGGGLGSRRANRYRWQEQGECDEGREENKETRMDHNRENIYHEDQ